MGLYISLTKKIRIRFYYSDIIKRKRKSLRLWILLEIAKYLATGNCVRTRQNADIFAPFIKFSLEVR